MVLHLVTYPFTVTIAGTLFDKAHSVAYPNLTEAIRKSSELYAEQEEIENKQIWADEACEFLSRYPATVQEVQYDLTKDLVCAAINKSSIPTGNSEVVSKVKYLWVGGKFKPSPYETKVKDE